MIPPTLASYVYRQSEGREEAIVEAVLRKNSTSLWISFSATDLADEGPCSSVHGHVSAEVVVGVEDLAALGTREDLQEE